jgi:glycosyltransferase involved in cell wall biosynthesis
LPTSLGEEYRAAITIPTYKDAAFLSNTVHDLEKATEAIAKNFQLIIAEDGSNSSPLVAELKKEFSNIVYIQKDERLGRGRALREAWNSVQADVYVYIDADMATSLEHFDAYRNLITLQHDYDLVTGSRYLRESITNRPFVRRIASTAYNWIIRIVFKTKVHDHQCGFKSFSRKLVETLARDAKSDSWFWDTEVIVIARSHKFRIKEIPIKWTEKKGRRTPLKRLANDVWLHGTGLLTLFWRVYVHQSGS